MLLIPTDDRSTLTEDAPSAMTAWTGVIAGPSVNGDGVLDEALSTLQAELDERGRESQYRIYVESLAAGDAFIPGARTTATAWIGVLVGILAPIVILLSRWPTVGLAATLVFVLAGLGAGIMCWIDTGDGFAQAAVTGALGAAVFALAAVSMIWLAAWHPTVLLLLAVPSVLSCLSRLYAGHVVAVVSGAKA